jgi:hypothetical protein
VSVYERWCQIALAGVFGGAIIVNAPVLLSALGAFVVPESLLGVEGVLRALPAITYFGMAMLSSVKRTASRRRRVTIWSISLLFWSVWSLVLLLGGWPLFPVVLAHVAGVIPSALATVFALQLRVDADVAVDEVLRGPDSA